MAETEAKELSNGYEGYKYNDYIEEGKNKLCVRCKFCGSKMLEKHAGNFIVIEKELPEIHLPNNETAEIVKEKIKEYYHVENMYIFENIGFTHEVDNCKYLSCADCDAGPVGWFDIATKHSYIALSRVQHNN